MITNKRCQQVYTAIFSTMIANNALSLPLHIDKLCDSLGIELCPLSSIVAGAGLSEQEIFDIWGNEDGAVMQCNGHNKIAYNDSLPKGRKRFSICEEISHVVLRHVEDSRFNVFNQSYGNRIYREYEEEARIGAGLLLCQPQYFFLHRDLLTPSSVSYLCDITNKCAEVRCDVLSRFETSIKSNPLFHLLPQPKVLRKIGPLGWDSVIA